MKIVYQDQICTVFQSELYATTSTIVQTSTAIIIADPNWLPSEVATIVEYVEEIRNGRSLYLLFTHSDFDHIIGFGAFPDAQVIASKELADHPDKETILEQVNLFDQKYYCARSYQHAYPVVDYPIQNDQETLSIGDMNLTFYKAPGHTNDGLITIIEPQGICIAGDYFSDVEFPFIYDDSRHYENTLKKLTEIGTYHTLRLLIPGHGNPALEQVDMLTRQKVGLVYIQQVRDLIKTGQTEDSSLELIKHYPYHKGQIESHDQNIKQIAKELGY
ncbi:MBL fold metallo-hydrolase [Bacillus testis]|uniref:MBL fold metallo-hydrolase n=1 Tax=Bacillus testis TaxID=1622072 RepID=UPI00067F70A9|nr:MBL fold metallo-hydrolase [Bacillus testis]